MGHRDTIAGSMQLRPVLFTALAALAAALALATQPPVTRLSAATGKTAARSGRIIDLDWRELLPEGERANFTAVAPAPVHDYRGEGTPPAVQTLDFSVNKSLEGAMVRLPGFIVPLEAMSHSGVNEFLLVPYFGSCIHVPPPPPNQIVYVHTNKDTVIDSIYDAYWITGKLHLQTRTTRLGSTAYELTAEKIEVYRY